MNKKIKYGIICVVGIVILLSMCFGCKKYDEKRQMESMKKEEQQAVEAANIAEQYVKKYGNCSAYRFKSRISGSDMG